MTTSEEFTSLTGQFRRELLAHCYRMLGSVHDAEDLVQETYLRAWRGYGRFEGRSSLRTWMYRIATHACLTALQGRNRRAMPSGLGAAAGDPDAPRGEPIGEAAWLQPIPDAALGSDPADPASVAAARHSTRLAFVAAMQLLPARQRAVLLLRDVLGWRAGEVAEVLGSTTAAVNSSLQRARSQLERLAPVEDELSEPSGPHSREVLDRYVAAFHQADVAALVQLLRKDVELEMPPMPTWYAGRDTVLSFYVKHLTDPGKWRMLPVSANGQPAAAGYLRRDDGIHRAHSIQVLTLREGEIARVAAFVDASLFPVFGLPPIYPSDPRNGPDAVHGP
jgi:RNA polymerase sigma-70 factor (ECF subfamily)